MPARYVLGAFGLGRHSGHNDAVFLYQTPHPTTPQVFSFSDKSETDIKKLSRSIFLIFFFLRWQTNPNQDRLLNTKKLDEDQEIEHV